MRRVFLDQTTPGNVRRADYLAVRAEDGRGRGRQGDLHQAVDNRVREVVDNFNGDGFDSLYRKYAGARPPVFTLPQRQQIKKIALSRPAAHGLPF